MSDLRPTIAQGQKILNTVQALIVGLDRDGAIRYFNNYCEKITGWSRQEVMGKSWFDYFIPERMRPTIQSIFRALLESEDKSQAESVILTRTGQERVISWQNVVLRDDAGQISLVVGTGIDVTEQRQMETTLQALNSAALAVQKNLDEQNIIALTAQELERMGFDCTVFLNDATDQTMELVHTTMAVTFARTTEKRPQAIPYRTPILQIPVVDLARRERHAILVTDPSETVRQAMPADARRLMEQIFHSSEFSRLAVAPMIVGDTFLGVLLVHSPSLTEQLLPAVTAFTNQIAVALRNARLYAEIQRQVAQQFALLEASKALSSTVDLADVLSRLAEQMCKAIDATSSYICDWDPQANTSTVLAEYITPDAKEQISDLGVTYDLERDFPDTVERLWQRLPQIVHRDDPAISAAERDHLEQNGAESTLMIPISVKDAVIGFAELWESRRWREFSPTEINLCQGIAQQAAVAIENARLFEAEAHRRQEAETLRQAATALTSTLNLKQVLQLILELVETVVKYDSAAIMLVKGDELHVVAGRGFPDMDRVMRLRFSIEENLLFQHLNATRAPLVLHDAQADGRFLGKGGTGYVRGWMSIPLKAKDRIIGALTIDSRQPGTYSLKDAEFVQALANQAAVAIENALLYETSERRRREAETLRAATQALSATLDLQQVFDLILSELQQVVPYDSASVQERKDNQLKIIGGRGFPNREEILGLCFDLTSYNNPNRQVVETRGPVILDDAPTQYNEFHREPHAQAAIRSWLGVPLLYGDQVTGIISLDKREAHFYTLEHAQVAQAFAAQAAIAIQNARLYETQRQQADELAQLHRASEPLLFAASTDVKSLAHNIIHAVLREFGPANGSLLLLDPQTGNIERIAAAGPYVPEIKSIPLKINGPGLVPRALASKKIVNVPNVLADPAYVPNWEQARSELAVPLLLGDQAIGVIDVQSAETNAFGPVEERLLTAYAQRAALALENARLYQETARRADEMASLYHIGLATSSSLSLDDVLTAIYEQCQAALPCEHFYVALHRAGERYIHFPIFIGNNTRIPTEPLDFEAGEGLTSFVIRQRAPLVTKDLLDNEMPAKPVHVTDAPSRNYLGVPLLLREQVIGVLSVQSSDPVVYSEDHVRLLTTIASQAAIAIENARLYEEAQREITERKRAEAALRESEARLHTLIDNLPVEFWAMDSSLYYTMQNAASSRIVGNVIGKQVEDLDVPTEVKARWSEKDRQVLDGNILHEEYVIEADDEPRVHESFVAPVRVGDKIIGLVGVATDITARKQAEEALQKAHDELEEYAESLQIAAAERQQLLEQLQQYAETLEEQVVARTAEIFAEKEKVEAILKSAADAIVITDHEGYITYVNDAFIALTGYAAPQVIGQLVYDLFRADNSSFAVTEMHQATRHGFVWRGDLVIPHQDGSDIQAETTLASVRDHDGQIMGYVGSLRDVRRARALERAKTEFLTNVSHQLRTPVTNLKAYAYLLTRGSPEKQTQYVQVVQNEIDKLTHLVQDLIEITALDAGPIISEWNNVSLPELINAIIVRYRSQAQSAGLALRADIADGPIPPAKGSTYRLNQALEQIVENALLFTEQGEIVIGVRLDTTKETPELVLWVSDTGPGISRADQEKLFERFYRGEIAKPGHIIGTGLGLSIAQMIVQAHRGHIVVRSAIGQGSTFEIRLPVNQ